MSNPTVSPSASATMQCMEVWGGAEAADSAMFMPGLDVWVHSRPHAGAHEGGDVHFLSSCATGRITRMLIADVSGHGAAVAGFANELRGLMRRYMNFMNQRAFVKILNRQFIELSDGGIFATAIVATYWAPTGSLVICNAGHPRPLYYDAEHAMWSVLSHTSTSTGLVNLPLGIVEASEYEQFGITINRGDLLILHTDALTEVRNADGKLLGEEGLVAMMNEIGAGEPRDVIAQVRERVAAWGGAEPDDDVTIVALRRNELEPQVITPLNLPSWIGTWGTTLTDSIRGRGPFPWPELGIVNFLGAFNKRINKKQRLKR